VRERSPDLEPVSRAAAARRPRQATTNGFVDRATVIRTAAELADRDGWRALTMSQVAKELDRHVSSLYAHVDSLADLQREVGLLGLDELADAVWRAVLGKVRADALAAIADVYVDYARRHPGRGVAMREADQSDPEVVARGLRLAEPIWATFRSFGVDEDHVLAAHHVFSATVLGLAQRPDLDDLPQAVALFVLALESGQWPVRA
jgi:AcrR family transcriptional regulator